MKINSDYVLKVDYSDTLGTWWYLVRSRGDRKEIIAASGEMDDCRDRNRVPLLDAKWSAIDWLDSIEEGLHALVLSRRPEDPNA